MFCLKWLALLRSQYVHDDPEGPDITTLVVLLRAKDLWS